MSFSFQPKNAVDRKITGIDQFVSFLDEECGPDVESIFLHPKAKGTLMAVTGNRKRRYLISELHKSSETHAHA